MSLRSLSKQSSFKKQSSSSLLKSATNNKRKSRIGLDGVIKMNNEEFIEQFFEINDDDKQDKGQSKFVHKVIYLLYNFEQTELHQKSEDFNPLKTYTPSVPECILQESLNSVVQLRPEIIYYLTVSSASELYEFYVEFYGSFDKDKNFILDQREFKRLMNFAYSEQCLGTRKFKIFINTMADIKKSYTGKLDDKILEELFNNFLVVNGKNLDYLQLFPFIFCFFIEYVHEQIKFRQSRLDLIRGTEIVTLKNKVQEQEIKNIHSLYTVLKEMGIDYLKQKHEYPLSFRDIENVLIKFKNIQKWITFEIIQRILSQLEKKMQIDERTKIEKKKMKLYKIVNFLALKLCIHQNCQQVSMVDKDKSNSQSIYLEILIFWNAAYYGEILQLQNIKNKKDLSRSNFSLQLSKVDVKQSQVGQTLHEAQTQNSKIAAKLESYLNKNYTDVLQFKKSEVVKVLEGFLAKDFAMMPKDQIPLIVGKHPQFKNNPERFVMVSRVSLIEQVHQMICTHTYDKLNHFAEVTFQGLIDRDNEEMQKKEKNYKSKHAAFIDFDAASPAGSVRGNNKDKHSDLGSPFFQNESKQQQQQQEDEINEDDYQNQESQIIHINTIKPGQSVIQNGGKFSQQNLDEDSPDDHQKQAASKGTSVVMNKFKKVVNLVKNEEVQPIQVKPKKDVLKACLIMDQYLKRQTQYHKKQQEKISQIQQLKEEGKSQTYIDEQVYHHNRVRTQTDIQVNEHKSKQSEDMDLKSNGGGQETKVEQTPNQGPRKKVPDKEEQEIKIVQGKLEQEFGPQNIKNAQSHFQQAKLTSKFLFMKSTQDENSTVIIDKLELERMLQNKPIKGNNNKSLPRDTCQCTLI